MLASLASGVDGDYNDDYFAMATELHFLLFLFSTEKIPFSCDNALDE